MADSQGSVDVGAYGEETTRVEAVHGRPLVGARFWLVAALTFQKPLGFLVPFRCWAHLGFGFGPLESGLGFNWNFCNL
ncbi:Coenzyme PQQ synthesis E [Gossypium arboreum]|uniref:Coenzyme PQQ synthesis E n=1 Tax=Gossypium arboreum TaxID=29729 RepID=A0A0B0M9T4_GOSAR|nr:Coenzyme PQQ synthesis E [Gossypium arboreum]